MSISANAFSQLDMVAKKKTVYKNLMVPDPLSWYPFSISVFDLSQLDMSVLKRNRINPALSKYGTLIYSILLYINTDIAPVIKTLIPWFNPLCPTKFMNTQWIFFKQLK